MEQILGDWVLEENIGSGGLAEVWKGYHRHSGAPAALKILREPNRSESHRDRFLREGFLLSRLEHPGIVRCVTVCREPRPFLVLELLRGETLSERLRESGQLSVSLASSMADCLLQALGYLHERGIIHRDVKSSNIFLTDDARVMLLDLGLATDPDHPLLTTLGDVMGTYAYMAPEQLAGAPVDRRSDLYSLGITLYEALAGRRPYRAKDAAGYLQALRHSIHTPLKEHRAEIPLRLLDLVSRLMARDPADRPGSAFIARALLTTSDNRRELRPPPLLGRSSAKGGVQGVIDGGGILLLLGEIGSGTSRLASHALRQARLEGMESIALRCRAGAHPLSPLRQIHRDLSQIIGGVPATIEAIGTALRDLAAEGPLLLLIEDIQHCPPETLAQLARIIQIGRELSVVITGTTAPEEITGHIILLRPLRPDESRKLVREMLGTSSPPAGLSEHLHRISDGQPGIVVAGMRELVERERLQCTGIDDNGMLRWELDPSAPLEPTAALARLYGDTLSELSRPARRILEVMAIAGETMPLDLVLHLTGSHPSGEDLGVLLKRGLITRVLHEGAEWISLRRPALGSLLLNQLSAEQQRLIHRSLAATISLSRPSDWREQLVSWHRAYGAPPDSASESLVALGEDLFTRGQPTRALSVLDRARGHILAAPRPVQARLELARGEVLKAKGRLEEAMVSLSRGRDIAESLGDAALQARALVSTAQVHDHQGFKQQAAVLAEEALALLEGVPDNPTSLKALLLAANSHRLGARRAQAAEMLNRCIDLSVDQDRREFAAQAHGSLGAMLAEDGQLKEAIQHIEQETAYARLHQDPAWMAQALCRLATCHRRIGRIDLARDDLTEAEYYARSTELPYELARTGIARAALHLALGDLASVGELLSSTRIALQSGARTDLKLAYREVVAHYRLAEGDRLAALATFQAAEAEADRTGFAILGAYFLGMIGVLTADPDALLEAMDLLEDTGDRRLSATLLYYGGTVGGDAEVLEFAVEEARVSGDMFLLLEVLHATGGSRAQHEAHQIVEQIEAHLPSELNRFFQQHPAVSWSRNGPKS
ncbi:MAG: tetratricopeptide (TPR) repeat protein, partial [Myxococcota bacterium]